MSKIAEQFATEAHAGQFRRDGVTPYIEHPREVASHFHPNSFEYEIAWLHDTIEDTDVNLAEIARLFSTVTTLAVEALTHRKGESYADYIDRVSDNKFAMRVKLVDIGVNLGDNPTDRQRQKYAKAIIQLARQLDFGQQ